jgi:hypothetical protein
MTDWRRQGQEQYLAGATLHRREWVAIRDDWDHDHCEFCGSKFSKDEHDQHVGYVTSDGYRWVCEECFDDFHEEFRWRVA